MTLRCLRRAFRAHSDIRSLSAPAGPVRLVDVGRQTTSLAVPVFVLGLGTSAAACSGQPDLFTPPTQAVTHAIGGTVTDAVSGAPVSGVLIKARTESGDSAPVVASAISGPDGKYRLLGLPSGVIHLWTDKYRYLETIESIDATTSGAHNFSVSPNPNVPDLSGSFTLTIEANADCATATNPLPPALRLRTFTAHVEHIGQNLTVRARTQWDAGGFFGLASNNGAQFWMVTREEFGLTVEDFVELIHPGNGVDPFDNLVFLGTASTTINATGLLGSMDGTITFYPVTLPGGRQASTSSCRGGRVEFTR